MKLPAARHAIRGFAWTGAGLVRGVEISTDGGQYLGPGARLESRAKAFSWVRWNHSWNAPVGDHVLMSRATDDAGPAAADRAETGSQRRLRAEFLRAGAVRGAMKALVAILL